jgi:predicted nucleic acid-binding protein
MTFVEIPAAATIFFDANVFVYHFEPHGIYGAACTDLLERVEHRELAGFTSAHVLSEVTHRLMAIEAMKAFGWPQAGIAVRLRNHPAQVQTLQQFRVALQEIPRFGIQVSDTIAALIDIAAAISQ